MTLATPTHALTFGALNLIGTAAEFTANGYAFEALGDDADWGNPVPVEDKVISWLQDGALIALKNYDNRDLFIRVRVRGSSSANLATAESALMLETGKPNLLTWTPPGSGAVPSVFSVVMSHLEQVTDDVQERHLERVYGLRVQAEPFVRSQGLTTVTVPAPTGTQTITTVDACTSATGWTQTVQIGTGSQVTTAATVAGGSSIRGSVSSLSSTQSTMLFMTRTGLSASMTTTPYLRVNLTPLPTLSNASWANGTSDVIFRMNGTVVPVALQVGNVYWLDASSIGVTTLVSFNVIGYAIAAGAGGFFAINIEDISRSNVLGDQGTGRQLNRTLAVAGSARTQGSLALADASAALGTTLVYTYPQTSGVIAPSLFQHYSSGGGAVTTDSTTVSGSTMAIDTGAYFEPPISGVPAGGYLLIARMKHASAGARTVTWSANGRLAPGPFGFPGAAQGGTTSFTSTAGGWVMVNVATLTLPTIQVGSSGKVSIYLQASTGVILDEAWIFNLDSGELTWVECGTASPSAGGTANRLWLDGPSVLNPNPVPSMGFASDRSDSYYPAASSGVSGVYSFGDHVFAPPGMNVFTVTTNSTAAAITLSHYARWHTNAVT